MSEHAVLIDGPALIGIFPTYIDAFECATADPVLKIYRRIYITSRRPGSPVRVIENGYLVDGLPIPLEISSAPLGVSNAPLGASNDVLPKSGISEETQGMVSDALASVAIVGPPDSGKTSFVLRHITHCMPEHKVNVKDILRPIRVETNRGPKFIMTGESPIDGQPVAALFIMDASANNPVDDFIRFYQTSKYDNVSYVVCFNKHDLMGRTALWVAEMNRMKFPGFLGMFVISVKTNYNLDPPLTALLRFIEDDPGIRILA